MMTAQRDMWHLRLPDKLEKDTFIRKEKLYNDVIGLLEKYSLSWNGKNAADTNGVRLVKVLEECLWYLDGCYISLNMSSQNFFQIFQATMYLRHPNIVSEHLINGC